MIDFKIFQNDLIELFEYGIAKEDKLYLACFTRMNLKEDVIKANKTHKCNTVACIGGYAPEVHPKRFKWKYFSCNGVPCAINGDWQGQDIVYAYQGLDSKESRDRSLTDIFEPNYSPHTDIEVATKRLEVIKAATSYDNLGRLIKNEYLKWF